MRVVALPGADVPTADAPRAAVPRAAKMQAQPSLGIARELIAFAECAASLAQRAARFADGKLHEKTNRRFDAAALAALSRTFAREAALKVADEGLRLVVGAGGLNNSEMPAFEAALRLPAIHCAQAGLIADMDYIADVLFDRVGKSAAVSA